MNTVKINPKEIPKGVYDSACRILSKSIRRFYEVPGNRKSYEEWMKTPEGQRAELRTPKERAAFDAARRKEQESG